jgi:hypothetical protein
MHFPAEAHPLMQGVRRWEDWGMVPRPDPPNKTPERTIGIFGLSGTVLWLANLSIKIIDWISRGQLVAALDPYVHYLVTPSAELVEFAGAVLLLGFANNLEHSNAIKEDAAKIILTDAPPAKHKRHWFWLRWAICIAILAIAGSIVTGFILKSANGKTIASPNKPITPANPKPSTLPEEPKTAPHGPAKPPVAPAPRLIPTSLPPTQAPAQPMQSSPSSSNGTSPNSQNLSQSDRERLSNLAVSFAQELDSMTDLAQKANLEIGNVNSDISNDAILSDYSVRIKELSDITTEGLALAHKFQKDRGQDMWKYYSDQTQMVFGDNPDNLGPNNLLNSTDLLGKSLQKWSAVTGSKGCTATFRDSSKRSKRTYQGIQRVGARM